MVNFVSFRINHLSTRYRENLELILKDVTVTVKPGEKVRRGEESPVTRWNTNDVSFADRYHRSNGQWEK